MAGNQSIVAAQNALSGARQDGNQHRQARALLDLGLAYAAAGLTVEATTAFEQAAELAHDLGDTTMLAKALANAGSQLHQSGQHREALELSRRAVAEFAALGDQGGELRARANCAVIERALGDGDAAVASAQAGTNLAKSLDDRALQLGLAALEADVLTDLGRLAEARSARQHAVQAARRLGDGPGLALQLERLGEAQLADGLHDDSLRSYFEAGELYRKGKDHNGRYRVALQLGLVYQHRLRWAEAEAALGEALALCRELRDGQRLGYITASLASAKLGRGSHAEAADLAGHAAEVYRRQSNAIGAGRALATLGQAQQALGRQDEAVAAWQKALSLLDGQDQVGAAAVRELLGS